MCLLIKERKGISREGSCVGGVMKLRELVAQLVNLLQVVLLLNYKIEMWLSTFS